MVPCLLDETALSHPQVVHVDRGDPKPLSSLLMSSMFRWTEPGTSGFPGPPARLRGRVALVTGASRGIGAAVSRAFAQQGAAVAVHHLPTPEMAKLAAELADEIRDGGGLAVTAAADISMTGQVASMVAMVAESLGPIDVLVTNAAANQRRCTWHEISEDAWDYMMAVNLKGTFLCARAVYPYMRDQGYGKIITVSSVMVGLGLPGALHYVASKAGLIGLTRALAREVGQDGIRVNAVMPGAIRTEREREVFPDDEAYAAYVGARQALTDVGTPEDLTGTFVYLASSDSDFVTGQVLTVDGGWLHW